MNPLPIMKTRNQNSRASGFTLVEVVVAVGVVAFGLIVVLGLYASVTDQTNKNTNRREIGEAIDALRGDLNDSIEFREVLSWAQQGQRELIYVTYRGDPDGRPNPEGEHVHSRWLDPAGGGPQDNPDLYRGAVENRWIKARLTPAPNNFPPDFADSDADPYPRALLLLQADFEVVPEPEVAINDVSYFSTQIGVLR